jgi:hypothetical protein
MATTRGIGRAPKNVAFPTPASSGRASASPKMVRPCFGQNVRVRLTTQEFAATAEARPSPLVADFSLQRAVPIASMHTTLRELIVSKPVVPRGSFEKP